MSKAVTRQTEEEMGKKQKRREIGVVAILDLASGGRVQVQYRAEVLIRQAISVNDIIGLAEILGNEYS